MIHGLDTPALARLLAQLSGDLVLVLDPQGYVLAVVAGGDAAPPAGSADWAGRPWAGTVALDSRAKVGRMLGELALTGHARRRELNHPSQDGACVAYAYRAQRLEAAGVSLAMGRDLSAQSALQQRLLQAQREAYSSSPAVSLRPKRRSLT
jgi:hypothetical protein